MFMASPWTDKHAQCPEGPETLVDSIASLPACCATVAAVPGEFGCAKDTCNQQNQIDQGQTGPDIESAELQPTNHGARLQEVTPPSTGTHSAYSSASWRECSQRVALLATVYSADVEAITTLFHGRNGGKPMLLGSNMVLHKLYRLNRSLHNDMKMTMQRFHARFHRIDLAQHLRRNRLVRRAMQIERSVIENDNRICPTCGL